MEIRHLRYFVAIAETGHLTRAAAQLGIQQPPLSQQIKALEDRLGTALFHRHPKGMALTDSGRLFLDEARRALRAFRNRYPEIALSLSEHNAAEITDRIAARTLHCGFLRVPVARPPGLAVRTLFAEPVVVAVPLDHRLARKPRTGPDAGVALKDFQGENLILVRRPGAPGLYANLLALCEQRGIYPNVVAEVDRMMTDLNLVAAGAGISVVPASMRSVHVHAVAYRPLSKGIRLNAPMTLVYRDADCIGVTATFVDLVTTIVSDDDGERARK